jgi:hypothetical protein
MSNNEENKYFAADESDKLVSYLEVKAENWMDFAFANGYVDKIKRSWRAYHGYTGDKEHDISYTGEQSELLKLSVNHYGNIAENMMVMITGARPSFQARAINTDKKSLIQADLANGLLDYYMREKKLEREIKRALRYAIVMGTGYIKLEWNSTKGKIYDYIEPDPDSIVDYDEDGNPLDLNGNVLEPIPVREGDIEFKTLSFFEVFFDSTKDTPEQHEWVVTRTFINKYNLMAKYPELKDKIAQIPTKDKGGPKYLSVTPYDETNDIAVYEFFHAKTEAVPEGRHVTYLTSECVLEDIPLEYEEIPVYRISPSDVLGTSYGHSPLFNALPIQYAIDSLYSIVLTNQSTFGVQNILNPKGNGIKVNQMDGGLNFIEFDPAIGPPSPFNATQTPAEIFNNIGMLEKAMETITGINSTVRGNPESQLRSGNALAMVQANALQFMSGLQQSYIQLLEDVGTGIVNLLKRFAKAPRVVAISGIRNATKMMSFKADDISNISRVVVDVGNALAHSAAGRIQIAENLLQMGAIKSVDKYVQLLKTGNLDTFIENEMDELILIRSENEAIVTGNIEVQALAYDNHVLHIIEHRATMADAELRNDVDLVMRASTHIQEHLNLLQQLNPTLAQILGQPVVQPPQEQLPPQGGPADQGMSPPPMPENSGSPELIANPEAQSIAVGDQLQGLPSLPRPADDKNRPITPEELLSSNVRG